MENLIRTEDIYKTYISGQVEVHAIRGVSLEVKRGEFIAIMGPSGSGKSTLLNILGCLDKPTKGSYLLEGKDISSLKETEVAAIRNKKIGFVFQNFNLLPRAKAIENVELPLLFSRNGLPNKGKKEHAREAFISVGLEGRENHYPSQLSGGEQQRVAIARAIVNDPLIILADEPTGNLDTKSSEDIMEIFETLNQNGKTIILITHEIEIANYAMRQVHFRDGNVIRDNRIEGRRDMLKIVENAGGL
ncbi:MAG: ABC transporter ATP-binding protein [Thermodesulfobacteriota bacterium]